MAGQPHDKTGARCPICKHPFVKSSAVFTIKKREGNMIIYQAVCGPCHHEHHSQGE